jgi:hypothetical protein
MKRSALILFVVSYFAFSWAQTAAVTTNAFYVAPNGGDTNPGTLARPFATLARCQAAMRASATNKTCYIRAGEYRPPVTGRICVWGNSAGSAISLDAKDSGETWSYYPPDGYNSAILNGQSTLGGSGGSGGNGVGCAFGGNSTTNIKIDGLQFENYQFSAFWGNLVSNLTFVNNTVHNLTSAVFVAGGVALVDSPGAVIRNNYMYDIAYIGIGAWQSPRSSEGGSNTTVANNAVINSCTYPAVSGRSNDQNGGDCGAIYFANQNPTPATNIRVVNNYVRDVNMSSNGVGDFGHCCATGIYLDNEASNITATGNLTAGAISSCFELNGGSNNLFQNNICDLDNSASQSIVVYQWSKRRFPMSDNAFINNIVIAHSSGKGNGYFGGSAPTPMKIQNNAYYNYGGSSIKWTGTPATGSDTKPTYAAPHFSCWTYSLNDDSPVYNSPVNFPHQPPDWGQPGFWGPPGFVIPQTGTPPSGCHGPSNRP